MRRFERGLDGHRAAGDDAGAFALCPLDMAGDGVAMGEARKRAEPGRGIFGMAHGEAVGLGCQGGEEPVEDRLLHEDARAGDAGLAARGEDAACDALHRPVEIGVGEDDVWGLAAEFEHYGTQQATAGLGDRATSPRAAREADEIDARVLDQRLAGVARAGDDIDDAGREARLEEQPPVGKGRMRRHLRRLQDDGVPGRQDRRELLGLERQWRIPRRDAGARWRARGSGTARRSRRCGPTRRDRPSRPRPRTPAATGPARSARARSTGR